MRRPTQAERRAATTAKLVDAVIDTIVESGFRHVSAREICRRSGVSQGGLFGRFESISALIAESAIEVGRRQLEVFGRAVGEMTDPGDVTAVLAVLRDVARSPINSVWVELRVAARTDEQLRDALVGVAAQYEAMMTAVADELPYFQGLPQELRRPIGALVLQRFDGEKLSASLLNTPEYDDIDLLLLTDSLVALRAKYGVADH